MSGAECRTRAWRAGIVAAVLTVSLAALPAAAQSRLAGGSAALPAEVAAVLEQVAQEAGVATLKVTSAERSVAEQARLMFAMLRCTGRRCPGLARVRADYCSIAGRALDDFERATDWNDARSGRAAFERALAQRLREAGNRRPCMMHVVGPGITPANFAVDLAPSTLTPQQRCAVVEALRRRPEVVTSRLFLPADTLPACVGSDALGSERAIHVEFFRGDGFQATAEGAN